jgi:co-chaperonin GroES (HSP10)
VNKQNTGEQKKKTTSRIIITILICGIIVVAAISSHRSKSIAAISLGTKKYEYKFKEGEIFPVTHRTEVIVRNAIPLALSTGNGVVFLEYGDACFVYASDSAGRTKYQTIAPVTDGVLVKIIEAPGKDFVFSDFCPVGTLFKVWDFELRDKQQLRTEIDKILSATTSSPKQKI